jgi:hypothetical protein
MIFSGWLSLLFAVAVAGSAPDGSVVVNGGKDAVDERVTVLAVLRPESSVFAVAWWAGLHGPAPRCFLEAEGRPRVPLFRDLPPAVATVHPSVAQVRHFSFAAGAVVASDGTAWIAAGCERAGSTNAICVERLRGSQTGSPVFLTGVAFPHEVKAVHLAALGEGVVGVLWQENRDVLASVVSAAGETRGQPSILLRNVESFHAVGSGDRVLVAATQSGKTHLLQFDRELARQSDRIVEVPEAAEQVRLAASDAGLLLIWVERESDSRVIRSRGADSEEAVVVARTELLDEPSFLATAGNTVVWRESAPDEAPNTVRLAFKAIP